MGNEVFIVQSVRVGREARGRLAQKHPHMKPEELDVVAHEAEIAYLRAVRDVFNSIAQFTIRAPQGPN